VQRPPEGQSSRSHLALCPRAEQSFLMLTDGEPPGRLLFVDDEPAMCDLVEAALGSSRLDVYTAAGMGPALELLKGTEVDVVVTDLNMRGATGLELCASVKESHPDLPVVILTGFGSMDAAIEAIRAGAYDFVTKPIDMAALRLVVERAVHHRRLTREVVRLRNAVGRPRELNGIVGDSPPMQALFDLLPRAARSDVPILISGESGTGKELVARAVHANSSRARGPFVAVNCAAIPEALLESELFGHTRGAFTDARKGRRGLFLQASEGTLFLDEVGDLPISLQPKLLRVLQERRMRPVGSDSEVPVNCRIVSASHVDLADALADGTFREDLYYRLNVIQLDLPPLRDRAGDIVTLAEVFLRRAAERTGADVTGLSTATARILLHHDWPGNVRELENCMERAVALTEHRELVPADLPARLRGAEGLLSGAEGGLATIEEVERLHILRVLELLDGRRVEAARVLGIDRKTLYRKLEKYGLPRSD